MLSAVQINGLAFQFASDALRSDVELALTATGQNWKACAHAGVDLLGSSSFMMSAKRIDEQVEQFATKELRQEWAAEAVRSNDLHLDANAAVIDGADGANEQVRDNGNFESTRPKMRRAEHRTSQWMSLLPATYSVPLLPRMASAPVRARPSTAGLRRTSSTPVRPSSAAPRNVQRPASATVSTLGRRPQSAAATCSRRCSTAPQTVCAGAKSVQRRPDSLISGYHL